MPQLHKYSASLPFAHARLPTFLCLPYSAIPDNRSAYKALQRGTLVSADPAGIGQTDGEIKTL